MDKYNLLDCTLRDGGYINKWAYSDEAIIDIIRNLIDAGLDFLEVGYINSRGHAGNTTQFDSIERIEEYLPKDRKNCILLAMADVQQFSIESLTEYTGRSIEGIRIVFYKYQVKEALELAKVVQACGYKLFMQPMVTIDYTVDEYSNLVQEISKLNPYAVSIVDSFGYMLKEDFRKYFRILDNLLEKEAVIGFHSHNNMDLAFITAQDILEYNTSRRIVIDSSLYGMGRGAGNLNTELIANYYNLTLGHKYNINLILDMISKHIMPIYQQRAWGYSPYLFITGLYHYHPNYACYLLEEHPEITVAQFAEFMETVPEEMKTRCKKQYVLQEWDRFMQDILC
ncbi:MAG: aldolase catalytic domain-containing protein [Ruminococcus flavefaciens]|nr:aldolase catalytic domain-containing protein [Ruminococcus flavefaciens]